VPVFAGKESVAEPKKKLPPPSGFDPVMVIESFDPSEAVQAPPLSGMFTVGSVPPVKPTTEAQAPLAGTVKPLRTRTNSLLGNAEKVRHLASEVRGTESSTASSAITPASCLSILLPLNILNRD